MKKIGIVFPGQGSQYIGMGKDLYERFDYVRDIFATADRVLGFPITDLCFNGPDDDLRQTYNTQPALLLAGYAVWRVLKEEAAVEPYLFAGHSLGEYTALAASGFFTFEDALAITRKRGLLMEDACPKGKGSMVALIGAKMEKVGPVLEEASHDGQVAVPANLNSADQIVLSGSTEALREAVEKLKGTGYKKAVFLNVSGPFHSPLMKEAADQLKVELAAVHHGDLSIPVVFNVDATPGKDRSSVVEKLYRQMFSPVLWEKCVRRMADEGVEIFLEAGPQKVLTNLIKRIVPDIPCVNLETLEEIRSVKELLA